MSTSTIDTETLENSVQTGVTQLLRGGWGEALKTILFALLLLVICLVAGLALAVVNSVTAPIIAEHTEAEKQATYRALLPEADSFTEVHGVVGRIGGDAGGIFCDALHAVAAGHANDAVGRGSRDCLTFGAHAELHAAGGCHGGDDNGLAGFFERLFHRFDFRRAAGLAGGGAQPAADHRDGFCLTDQSQNLLQRLFLCNNHEV